jgi:processive 1,2-diacylglycerol beta-glucosyltransferase
MDVARDHVRTALILSGSIGRGHDSVAEACAAALDRADYSTTILDCIGLLGGWERAASERVFRGLLAVPPIYDAFHFSHLRTGSRLARRIERTSATRLVPQLRDQIADTRPRLLVSVFATGAGAAGRLTSEFPAIGKVVVCTDATAHRIWVHPGIDRYVVFSATAEATVRQHLPTADIARIPPPVRPSFFERPSRADARAALGIDPDVPCALVMGGGWGLVRLVEAAKGLVDAGYRVIAVAGANRRLESRLRAAAAAFPCGGPGLTAFGFTREIPALMAASDVVVTSPGQTVHETRVAKRPLVILDTVPGHGRENLLLELERGGALVCRPTTGDVVAAAEAARAGLAPSATAWPISTSRQWEELFLSAIGDLIAPAGRTAANDDQAGAAARIPPPGS